MKKLNKKTLGALALTGALFALTTQINAQSKSGEESMNPADLESKLNERKSSFSAKAPKNVKTIYAAGIQAIVDGGITEQAKQQGDKAPDFSLTNAKGETVHLKEVLKKGPVVLTWYRGGWCPYCNLTLNALQKELPNFKAAGATLIALTPEVPDQSLSTAEKNELDFEVLSDIDSHVAREYGIVFTLTDDVAKIYEEKFGLSAYNGNDSNELPLAATYIIGQDGTITYAFLDADYRNRAEPSALTAELNK